MIFLVLDNYIYQTMKKSLFTIILFFLVHICFAQETQTVVRDSSNYREVFEVLKSDKNIKQGQYLVTAMNGSRTVTTGFYKNNRKDSIWREYDSRKNVIAEGRYKQGKRVGEWAAYGNKQQLLSKYDFDKDRLMFFADSADAKTKKYKTINSPGDTVFTTMDRPPLYITGKSTVARYLTYNIKYPVSARREHATGTVVITFTIDEYGHAKDHIITKSVSHDCDVEALRAVKALPDDWLPGKLNGKKVAALIEMPIVFYFFN